MKYENKEKCATPHLDEKQIKQAFISAMNKLITGKERILADFKMIRSEVFDTSDLETEKAELEKEMELVSELTQECINQNSYVAQNQTEYEKQYNGLVERFDKAKARYDEVEQQIKDKNARCENIKLFMKNLKRQTETVTEFDETLWLSMVDFITVNSKEDIQITFKNGMEIKE